MVDRNERRNAERNNRETDHLGVEQAAKKRRNFLGRKQVLDSID